MAASIRAGTRARHHPKVEACAKRSRPAQLVFVVEATRLVYCASGVPGAGVTFETVQPLLPLVSVAEAVLAPDAA